MKLITCSLLMMLLSPYIHAQDSTLVLSAPIDISKDGWNKVVQVSSGNTLLFHFELRKSILVKVFDKTGKEIASQKHLTKLIDLTTLDNAFFDGAYDINGEAVLFMTQDVDNVETIVRLRFNSANGNLISEDRVVRAESYMKTMHGYLLKSSNEDMYSVFCFMNLPADTAANLKLIQYNNKHEILKEIPYSINKKGIDEIDFVTAKIDVNGDILIAVQLSKIIQYPTLYDRTLVLMYLPKGENKFTVTKAAIQAGIRMESADFTVNSFAGSINLYATNVWSKYVQNGLNKEYYDVAVQTMYLFPSDFSAFNHYMFKFNKATECLRSETHDTTAVYSGRIKSEYTNDRGVTSIVFESAGMPRHVYENWSKYSPIYAGNISITQFDDAGNEMWATVIPKNNIYLHTESFPKVFRRLSRDEYCSTLTLHTKKNVYALFNNSPENFDKTLADKLADVFDYEKTNAVLYSVGKRNVITKKYLIANAKQGEFYSILPMSGYFNTLNNNLAILVRRKDDNKSTFHIAWRKMED